jgi:PAS domain-containing protein
VTFPGQEFHHALFQAMPVPILVVDRELEVWECNAAAARSMSESPKDKKRRMVGQALKCVHADAAGRGCGQAEPCADCTIHWAVRAAAEGQRILRQWARVDIEDQGKPARVNFQISSTPSFSANIPWSC